MHTIRVLHEEDAGCWSFSSPDLDAQLTGGEDSYRKSRRMAEEAVRFYLETDDVIIEHYVRERAPVAAA